jgi:hypothetical protein
VLGNSCGQYGCVVVVASLPAADRRKQHHLPEQCILQHGSDAQQPQPKRSSDVGGASSKDIRDLTRFRCVALPCCRSAVVGPGKKKGPNSNQQ